MRSRLWYVVACVIALAGLVAAALYVVPRIGTVDQGAMRLVMPGSAVLALDTPGSYTIFHERRSVVDGRYYASDSVDGLKVTLADPRGAPVALAEPTMSTSYQMGNREGRAMLAFEVAEPGRYRLTASLASGGRGTQGGACRQPGVGRRHHSAGVQDPRHRLRQPRHRRLDRGSRRRAAVEDGGDARDRQPAPAALKLLNGDERAGMLALLVGGA
jgi:hypothetical protein